MNSTAVIAKSQEAKRLTGAYTRVAKKLGLSANHVREVALGNRTSGRVMQALCHEYKRIERAA